MPSSGSATLERASSGLDQNVADRNTKRQREMNAGTVRHPPFHARHRRRLLRVHGQLGRLLFLTDRSNVRTHAHQLQHGDGTFSLKQPLPNVLPRNAPTGSDWAEINKKSPRTEVREL